MSPTHPVTANRPSAETTRKPGGKRDLTHEGPKRHKRTRNEPTRDITNLSDESALQNVIGVQGTKEKSCHCCGMPELRITARGVEQETRDDGVCRMRECW
ncbi:hypothetical protein BaRGS_00023644 [Batillaria attramentaria]|uniref:Uncharacterized protein n=1 Tax=Batillaria attramentaria TaxID=370345 RepID=A0ABD0KD80_9CAEN